jgi:hypothetical protein
LDEIVEKLQYESIAFLKKTNYDLHDYDGKFSILKELSFSRDVNSGVQEIAICLLKLKFKKKYFFYNVMEDLQVDIDRYKQKEIDKLKDDLNTFIKTESFDLLYIF